MIEIKYIINVTSLNHPETISYPSPWKNNLSRNQFLLPKRLGTAGKDLWPMTDGQRPLVSDASDQWRSDGGIQEACALRDGMEDGTVRIPSWRAVDLVPFPLSFLAVIMSCWPSSEVADVLSPFLMMCLGSLWFKRGPLESLDLCVVSRLGDGASTTGPLVTAFYLILAVALVPRYASPPAPPPSLLICSFTPF